MIQQTMQTAIVSYTTLSKSVTMLIQPITQNQSGSICDDVVSAETSFLHELLNET